jgi:L-2-hydroxycarboxylate dehydrogenase (NAD+)
VPAGGATAATYPRFDAARLTHYTTAVFERVGVPRDQAAVAAEILVASDLRGIDSHGMPRLRGYLDRIKVGAIDVKATPTIDRETAVTAAVDAHNGLGMPSAHWAMRLCIRKALESGLAFVTVRRSNHFGIAGYYATMALEHDLIGVSMTNAAPLMVPPFAKEPLLGTNPIGFAVPAGNEKPFVLDMAVTSVAWGKIEIARREEHPIPPSWALDAAGKPTTDPFVATYLQPLGGARESSGQKGYGLATFFDILCGPLGGAAIGLNISRSYAEPSQVSNTGHFFAAWRPDAFRPIEEFRADVDELLHRLRTATPADGFERVYVAGDLEFAAEEDRRTNGIPLHPQVVAQLERIADELDVPFEAAV